MRVLISAAFTLLLALLVIGGLLSCGSAEDAPAAAGSPPATPIAYPTPNAQGKVVLSDEQWKARLSPAAYQVLRHKETEPAFCGGYTKIEENGPGTYRCAGCGYDLFTADTKFHSGTGWPSFFKAVPGHVEELEDDSYGMQRTEVHCARCGGHLGHVFKDGPEPTGLRYCINAVCLDFVPAAAPAAAPAAPGQPATPATPGK